MIQDRMPLADEVESKSYAKAWQTSKKYIRWGLFWGGLLLLAGRALENLHGVGDGVRFWLMSPLISVCEHLGAGFVVSAIAVYFYEWGAHAKKVIDLMAELRQELAKQKRITTAKGRDCLKASLAQILSVESDDSPSAEAAKVLDDLSQAVGGLCNTNSRADGRYLNVVVVMLKEVQQNADSLRTLDQAEENSFLVTSAPVLADTILAAQMSAMEKGDVYEVVSDLASWRRDQLSDFRREARTAVSRGVQVRRIFNLFHEGAYSLSEPEVRTIISKHLREIHQWVSVHGGKYEVACFGERELANLPEQLHHEARREHFGVFIQGEKKTRFEVRELDLSHMTISRRERLLKRDMHLFDKMWSAAVKYSVDSDDETMEQEKFISYVEAEVRSRRMSGIGGMK